jgi:hypothetical protein
VRTVDKWEDFCPAAHIPSGLIQWVVDEPQARVFLEEKTGKPPGDFLAAVASRHRLTPDRGPEAATQLGQIDGHGNHAWRLEGQHRVAYRR